MEKVIPILGCPDIRIQVAFYEQLGFELIEIFTSPNPYASMKLGTIELDFYGSKKVIPNANSTMCYIRVNDVDALHDAFANSIIEHTGKVPRWGIPRFTTVRDLKQDRRFTLTDTGGNTLFIGTPIKKGENVFYRTLENEKYAKLFTVLYDIVYSKEDPEMAAKNLSRYGIDKALLNDLDKAKYFLVVLDIQNKTGQHLNDNDIKALLETHKEKNEDWEKIQKKYFNIMQKN
jgi:hypothetical protein